jgi:hypothetical protein
MNAERHGAVIAALVLSMMGQFQEHLCGGGHIKRRRRPERTRKMNDYIFSLERKGEGVRQALVQPK